MTETERHLIATMTTDDGIDETDLGPASPAQIEASDADAQGMGFILVDLDGDPAGVLTQGSQDEDWARRNDHRLVTAYVAP